MQTDRSRGVSRPAVVVVCLFARPASSPSRRVIRLLSVLALLLATPQFARANSSPSGWSIADIGNPLLAGTTLFRGGSMVVSFAGLDIWGTTDQFRFVYQPLTGDGEIVTRVSSFQGPYLYSKAGVMIRESLAAGSKHGHVLVTPSKGVYFQWRASTSGSTASVSPAAGTAPVWLKLARRGSVLTAFRSADGVNWTTIGTQTVGMESTVYVGVTVTSLLATLSATATFTDFSVKATESAGGSNQAPSVSLTSPSSGAAYTAPATIALAANAADSDGTVARVDFYSGSTLLATDVTAPYAYSWTGVPAGSYSLTAVARDNAGETTVSSERTVTVTASGFPTHVSFVPSTNDAVAVSSYRFEIYPATANPLLSNAAGSQDLGKPPVVDGQAVVDVRQTISALAPGTYVGVIAAIGSAGSVRSAPSPAFTR
jgi:regulation of enolase protein 1 (concanavalin A-like superfamily)